MISAYLIFRTATVQTWVTTKIANNLSTKLNTNISIGGVDISWFMKGILEDVKVDDQKGNPLISINEIKFGLYRFSRKKNILTLSTVEINDLYFALRTYKGENDLNLQFIIDYFASSDTSSSEPMKFGINDFILKNSHFILDNENYDKIDYGFDYNHMNISKINIDIHEFKLDSGRFIAQLNKLTANDTSGFILNDLTGQINLGSNGLQITNMNLITPNSNAYLQFGLEYNRWGNWLDFIDSVGFDSDIDSCNLHLNDIAYFAPQLRESNINITSSGNIKGTVSNLKLRNFTFTNGDITYFNGKINISGLPDIEKSFIDVKVNEFITNQDDINNLRLPGNTKIEIPVSLANLRNIKINGRFTGFYNDFVSNASFVTGLGKMSTDILIKPLKTDQKIAYSGKIKLTNFDIGGFFGSGSINNLSLNGEIKGKGIDENAEAEVNIGISNIIIAKYSYKDARIIGNLKNKIVNATVKSQDSIFKVYAKGSYDFSDSLPKYNFLANVENARFNRLFLSESDSFGMISGNLMVDAIGDNVDNLTGNISVDSLYYYKLGKLYSGDSLRIFSKGIEGQRLITLKSKYIDGQIEGEFKFANLGDIYPYILENFIPALMNSGEQKKEELIAAKEPMQFNFNFDIKKSDDLSEIFYPSLIIADNSNLNGYFNGEKDTLLLSLNTDYINYNNIEANQLKLLVANHLDTFDIQATAESLMLAEGMVYDSVVFNPTIYRDSAQILLSMGKSDNHSNSIFINTGLQFAGNEHIKASINNLSIWINDSNWVVNKPNQIEYKSKYLRINDFTLSSKSNNLIINGLLTESPEDILKLNFNNFDLKFLNYYLSQYYVNLGGKITGNLELSNIWDQFNYLAEFGITDFEFNETKLGNAELNSFWNPSRKAVVIDLFTELERANIKQDQLNIKGFYYPDKEEDNLDLKAKINKFPLHSVQPFLSSFSSEIEGTASGEVSITGKLNEPIIEGKLKADVKALAIDYLKTSYSLNDNLIFTKNYFGFENAKIYDNKFTGGNSHTGNLLFKLHHENFQNMRLELNVKANELEMLNTTEIDNELFYGYAVGSGDVSITGPFNDLYFNINVKPLRGSKIAIPMTETATVSDNEFIHFVIKDSSLFVDEKEKSDDFSLSMDLRFDMTPEATVQLVMDEKVGDIITANGSGIIRIHVDKLYNVDMYGSYQIEKGDYLFTLQNIINKHFILEPGGSIVWDGDLLDARIDMNAIYRTEAKLYDLLQSIDTTEAENYKRRSKVDCKIKLEGTLSAPEVSFGIDLPEESNETREKIAMILYTSSGTSNMDIMNKNFISLLMLGKFQAPGGFTQGANPNALASNATEMLASQVSNWLNKLSNEVDIGLAYDIGDEATSQEIAVALSYQAFNDRLMIDGKFGTGGESKSGEDATRIVGDLNVEWAITKDKNFRAKVFNRTNYEDPITRKAPYTQGAGFVYRKEFDNLHELFNRTKKEKAANSEPIKE